MRFKDRVAVVTGAGSGIGAATARRLASEGAAVVCADWNEEGAAKVAAEIEAAGGRAAAVKCDVSRKADCDAAVKKAVDAFGGLHVLVNNAGITRDGFAKKLGEDKWDQVLAVNLKGTFLMCQSAMLVMMERNYGRIVNTASVAVLGNPGQANYAASKAGVIGLTRTLALELSRNQVTVNCVAPGATDTAMFNGVPDDIKAKIVGSIPLKRMAKPEEVAALHAFLASDDAAYITGQVVFCDGGSSVGA
ncbi:MAG: beta-ketoacyl-ACP reductase [Planctomycetaceae bacterium]|nr:beta-ketoacyl-ACP reductase [Planctomycetota bacterium]NUN53403.1 beta-ketoacyl-ACP reductase [Planctomycetaceae bacterium]